MDNFDFNDGTPNTAHIPYTSGYSGIWGIGHVFYRDADFTIDNFRTETAAAGDYNRDGVTDAADYVLWRKTLGQMGPIGNCTPDCFSDPIIFNDMRANGAVSATYTQTIDDADYIVWRNNFGTLAAGGGGSVSSAGAIPEPTTAALLMAAWFGLWCGRRRAV